MGITQTYTLTQNPITDLARMWGGVSDVRDAHAVIQAENIKGVGGLLSHFGVQSSQLERLGMSPVNAKALLSAEGWRGTLNVSKQLSSNLASPTSALLDSVKNGWGSLEETMPNLAGAAKNAASTCKAAATGLADGCKAAVGAAKTGGFFGSIFKGIGNIASSIGRVAEPIMGPLAKIAAPVVNAFKGVGNFMRMIPGLNLIFAATDTFKAVTSLFDPKKPWSEKIANLGKAALSIGAALPIPGASLLGGARGVWAVGDAASSLVKHV
jgi:hypothetical protein